jgi:hypothetical protein
MVLKHPEALSDPAREALQDSFNSMRQGSANSHKTLILEEGMDVTSLAVDPKKAMVIETRKFSVTEIARWFRIPPDKIGDLDRATFSNIEQQNINYSVETLQPWVTRWEQEIEFKLLSKVENIARFNMNALLRGDAQSRGNYYNTMFNIGAISINEIRELEGFNSIGEEGNGHYVPMNMTIAGDTEVEEEEEENENEENDVEAFEPIVKKAVMVVNNKQRNAESKGKKLDMDTQCLYAFQTLAPILETALKVTGKKVYSSEKIGAFFAELEFYYGADNNEADDEFLTNLFFQYAQ